MTNSVQIHSDVLRLFPSIEVFSLTVRGRGVPPDLSRLAAQRLAEAADACTRLTPSTAALMSLPVIAQWREAYRAMGVKPSTHRCSFESLARRAIAGKQLATSVPMVNLYNAASLRHQACLGAYDLARLGPQALELRMCRPQSDRFSPLGGRADELPLCDGLAVYAQGDEVLCWGLNHRDSQKSCLSTESTEMVFMAEAVTAEQAENAERALSQLRADIASMGFESAT